MKKITLNCINYKDTFLTKFFTTSTAILGGVLVSSYLVAKYIWRPNKKYYPKKINYEGLYEYQCFKEYNELENSKLSDEQISDLKKCEIIEETPRGKVVLHYDKDFNSFSYYADDKTIPYKYLDTVARIYVIKNDCKSLYVNIIDEYWKGVERMAEEKKKDKEKEEKEEEKKEKEEGEVEKSIYANFKHYNKGGKGVENKVIKKYAVLRESSNRYKWLGSYKDYELAKEEVINKENKESEIKKIDFATFKKMKNEK